MFLEIVVVLNIDNEVGPFVCEVVCTDVFYCILIIFGRCCCFSGRKYCSPNFGECCKVDNLQPYKNLCPFRFRSWERLVITIADL